MKSGIVKFAQMAAIGFALAFTFSCSSDDGNNNNDGTPSGGGGGCPNAATGSGTLSCGGQTYKTVVIGSQTWMAQNLNYAIGESKCYGDSEANCTTYGRLYDWNTARLACPSGWHLPSHAEWSALTDYVGKETAGTQLKAESFGGTDNHKFAAIGGGQGNPNGTFSDIDEDGNWWSATENSASDNSTAVTDDPNARVRNMLYNKETVGKGQAQKTYLFSVRCLKN